ncbi:expressed unknown protein [Seminavis robusta]|uniref:Uncharacterized protein n=1 Tax=Seminavis robusta TaxID=568900 RepID=A0A9N8DHK5_9STRA|nr:expressed unknown protein [Seminavis robusta]|eukprot:Sro149_g068510.1 n/a (416) ;mRNA; f:62819-64066
MVDKQADTLMLREALLLNDAGNADRSDDNERGTLGEAEERTTFATRNQQYLEVTWDDFPRLYFCLNLLEPIATTSSGSCPIAESTNDGPLILSLDGDTAEGAEDQIQHPKLLKCLAWLLYEWVHKWQFVLYAPHIFVASMFVITADTMKQDWDFFCLWLFLVSSAHLFLLWVAALVLPLDRYSGVQVADLTGTAVVGGLILFCGLARSDYRFEQDILPSLLLGKFIWLALTLRVRSCIFSDNQRKQRSLVLIFGLLSLACADAGAVVWALAAMLLYLATMLATMLLDLAYVLLFLATMLLSPLAFFGICRAFRNTGRFISCLAFVCPCLQIRDLKRMELDAFEMEYDQEDAAQANVDQQIHQLGRPMHTVSTYLERGQKSFATTAGLLALWTLIWTYWLCALVMSYTMDLVEPVV